MPTLLLTEMFPPKTGGSSRWFWEIYRRLPREEFVIAAGEDPRQAEVDQFHNLRVIRLPLQSSEWGVFSRSGLTWYWGLMKRFGAILKSEDIDQIHCGRSLPEGWIAWMLKQRYGLPYACYVHGEEVNAVSVGKPTGIFTSRQLRWMIRKVVAGSKFVIANSRNTQQILLRDLKVPHSKIHVMYPGVDTGRFVVTEQNEVIRRRLGWNDRQVVLTVGRLETRKGHDQLILALRSMRKLIPNILYAIVGTGEREQFLRSLVKKEGLSHYVQFLNEVNDEELVQCYQQCDVFVLPNRQIGNDIEGFGMVLLEAQACGKPVIAGASGGTEETMRIPQTGRVILCDGPHELQKVIVELLNDRELRSRMGQAARQWVVENFDWTPLSRQARALFQQSCMPV